MRNAAIILQTNFQLMVVLIVMNTGCAEIDFRENTTDSDVDTNADAENSTASRSTVRIRQSTATVATIVGSKVRLMTQPVGIIRDFEPTVQI